MCEQDSLLLTVLTGSRVLGLRQIQACLLIGCTALLLLSALLANARGPALLRAAAASFIAVLRSSIVPGTLVVVFRFGP